MNQIRWSLRYRFMIPLLFLLVLVVIIGIWAAFSALEQAREQMQEQVSDIVATLKQSSFPLSEQVLHLMKGFSGADYYAISKEGVVTTTLKQMPKSVDLLGDDTVVFHNTSNHWITIEGSAFLCHGVELIKPPNTGTVVYILHPEVRWRTLLWNAVQPSLFLGILGSMLAIGWTIVLSHSLTKRIRSLEHQTRLIANGDFSPMPLPEHNDEIHHLCRSINEMAQQLADYQEVIRTNERLRLLGQLGSGLAHQLRNGVAGARLAVQLFADEAANLTEKQKEPLTVALRQLALVELNIKQFLDLGRNKQSTLERWNLANLMNEAIELLSPRCQHAGITVKLLVSPDAGQIDYDCDVSQFRHTFVNLLTNAAEAAGPGGLIEVSIAKCPTRDVIEITIIDDGPGPPAEIADKIFDPFQTGKKEGVGLGLAVAKQVITGHGGNLDWKRIDHRTAFAIVLPLENKK